MNLTDLHYVVEIDKSGQSQRRRRNFMWRSQILVKRSSIWSGNLEFLSLSGRQRELRRQEKWTEISGVCQKDHLRNRGNEKGTAVIWGKKISHLRLLFRGQVTFPVHLQSLSGMQSKETAIKAEFQENSSMHAIENVLQNGYSMGIIRYLCENEPYFQSLLDLKGLDAELLAELPYVILTSADGDLAKRELKTREELEDGVEILHGDWKLPTGEYTELSENGESLHPHNKIYIFERGSQFDILREVKNSYMWVSPVPEKLRKNYNLVQKHAGFSRKMIRDVLIYKRVIRKNCTKENLLGI